MADPISWTTILGLTIGIAGTMQSSLFTYSAVMGLGKGDGWQPPPEHWGKPWKFSIATGLNGPRTNATDPLHGSGGPFPEVHLFNDAGEYLGASKDKNLYIGHNRALALDIYPINVHKHEDQYVTYAILAGKGAGRDPLCIVDLGLGKPSGLEDRGGEAFGAYTPSSCGASWYHSGVYREDRTGCVPCFWLGGYGVQGMQVHLPSHTLGKTRIPFEDINKTMESRHDWFCNRPAVLSLWPELPPAHKVPSLLITDMEKRAGRTLNDTLQLHRKGRLFEPGKPGKPAKPAQSLPRSVQSPAHEDTVTIAHELAGLSAIELCGSALSMGPDYVNIPERKFCRMSDKTLWPTCGHHSKKVGPTDDCFDVESRQLVVGGKVTRSKPYSKEINFPLK